MSETHTATWDHDEPQRYAIRLEGHLDNRWASWLEGLTITLEDNGVTLLQGAMADQAALHGLMRKVRDLGLPLLSVTRIAPEQSDAPDAPGV